MTASLNIPASCENDGLKKRESTFKRFSKDTSAIFLLAILVNLLVSTTNAAPFTDDLITSHQSQIAEYYGSPGPESMTCYYNFQTYQEGDRIITNEPCLNCTCHRRMLMCYLRVCPFTKSVGQNCTVEKRPDQCCPVFSCPEVPVQLLTSTTTSAPSTQSHGSFELGMPDTFGCTIDNSFYADGAQVPSDPRNPCELCYCIRNRTACVLQECTLNVEGCKPVHQPGVCCPVRYDCDYEEVQTSSEPMAGSGLLLTTTQSPQQCIYNSLRFNDGELIPLMQSELKSCQRCYCMRSEIVCAVQECGNPLEGKDCEPLPPPEGQCCPTTYKCANETVPLDSLLNSTEFSSGKPVFHDIPSTEHSVYQNSENEQSSDETKESNEITATVSNNHIEQDVADSHNAQLSAEDEITKVTSIAETHTEISISTKQEVTEKPVIENEETTNKKQIEDSDKNVDSTTPIIKVNLENSDEKTEEVYNKNIDSTTVKSSEDITSHDENNSQSEDLHSAIISQPEVEISQTVQPSSSDNSIPSVESYIHDNLQPSVDSSHAQNLPSETFEADDLSEDGYHTGNLSSESELPATTVIPETKPNHPTDNEEVVPSEENHTTVVYDINNHSGQDAIHADSNDQITEDEINHSPDSISQPSESDLSQISNIHDYSAINLDSNNEDTKNIITSTTEISKIENNDMEISSNTQASINKLESDSLLASSDNKNEQQENSVKLEKTDVDATVSEPNKEESIFPSEVITEKPVFDNDDEKSEVDPVVEENKPIEEDHLIENVQTDAQESEHDVDEDDILETDHVQSNIPEQPSTVSPTLPIEADLPKPAEPEESKPESDSTGSEVEKNIEVTTIKGDEEKLNAEITTVSSKLESNNDQTITHSDETSLTESETLLHHQNPQPESDSTVDNEIISDNEQQKPILQEGSVDQEPDAEQKPIQEQTTYISVEKGVIPGEGSCLVSGVTYLDGEIVPATNPCHTECKCHSSLVKCVTAECPPPPDHMKNCIPVQQNEDDCCPMYACVGEYADHITLDPPQSHIVENGATDNNGNVESSSNANDEKPEEETSNSQDITTVPSKSESDQQTIMDSHKPVETNEQQTDISGKPENVNGVTTLSPSEATVENIPIIEENISLDNTKEPDQTEDNSETIFDHVQESIEHDDAQEFVEEHVPANTSHENVPEDLPQINSDANVKPSEDETTSKSETDSHDQHGVLEIAKPEITTILPNSEIENHVNVFETELTTHSTSENIQPEESNTAHSSEPSTHTQNVEYDTEHQISENINSDKHNTEESTVEKETIPSKFEEFDISELTTTIPVESLQETSNPYVSEHSDTGAEQSSNDLTTLKSTVVHDDNNDSDKHLGHKETEETFDYATPVIPSKEESNYETSFESESSLETTTGLDISDKFPILHSQIQEDLSSLLTDIVQQSVINKNDENKDTDYPGLINTESSEPVNENIPFEQTTLIHQTEQASDIHHHDNVSVNEKDSISSGNEYDETLATTTEKYISSNEKVQYQITTQPTVAHDNIENFSVPAEFYEKPLSQIEEEFLDSLHSVTSKFVPEETTIHNINEQEQVELDESQPAIVEEENEYPTTQQLNSHINAVVEVTTLKETDHIPVVDDQTVTKATESEQTPDSSEESDEDKKPESIIESDEQIKQETEEQVPEKTDESDEIKKPESDVQTPEQPIPVNESDEEQNPETEVTENVHESNEESKPENDVQEQEQPEKDNESGGQKPEPEKQERPEQPTNEIVYESDEHKAESEFNHLPEQPENVHESDVHKEESDADEIEQPVTTSVHESDEHKPESEDHEPEQPENIHESDEHKTESDVHELEQPVTTSVHEPDEHKPESDVHEAEKPENVHESDEQKPESEVHESDQLENVHESDEHKPESEINVTEQPGQILESEEEHKPIIEESSEHPEKTHESDEHKPENEIQESEPLEQVPGLNDKHQLESESQITEQPEHISVLDDNEKPESEVQTPVQPQVSESDLEIHPESETPLEQDHEQVKPESGTPAQPELVLNSNEDQKPVNENSEQHGHPVSETHEDKLEGEIQTPEPEKSSSVHESDAVSHQTNEIKNPGLVESTESAIVSEVYSTSDTTQKPFELTTSFSTSHVSSPTLISESNELPANLYSQIQQNWSPKPFSTEEPHFPDEEQQNFQTSGTGGGSLEYEDEEDENSFGPGTCRYGGKVFVSAQQVPRDNPCDFCFCFRSDIICLQQSCPPPIHGCRQETIQGFCCPRYECPVSMATSLNLTTTTTTTTTTLPPHFLSHAYRGAARRTGCQVQGKAYKVGDEITSASGPCLQCICGANGQMQCEPKNCSPEPMLKQLIEATIVNQRR